MIFSYFPLSINKNLLKHSQDFCAENCANPTKQEILPKTTKKTEFFYRKYMEKQERSR